MPPARPRAPSRPCRAAPAPIDAGTQTFRAGDSGFHIEAAGCGWALGIEIDRGQSRLTQSSGGKRAALRIKMYIRLGSGSADIGCAVKSAAKRQIG